jgi:predicted RND superfamily exporter protein
MTWWNVNLDAISMITIIMSVGFSVDYSAHITFSFVVCDEIDPKRRMRVALATVAWPILQVRHRLA